jgi:large subunit ribosomal protein L4e
VASAHAPSAQPPLVMARGHVNDQVPEMPHVVGGDVESTKKTAAFVKLLATFGCAGDVDKVKDSKKLRVGKGKMRNRRYVMRKGPLVVYDAADGIQFAARNIPGVDLVQVERLNLLQLAPGGHLGRLVMWTEAAFKKLDAVFGDGTQAAALKKGYVLPKASMANSDIARIINSDEVQSVVNPAKEGAMVKKVKINPLKNVAAMEALNPYVRIMRKKEQEQQDARKATKAQRLADSRANTAKKDASKAFYAKASAEGEIAF